MIEVASVHPQPYLGARPFWASLRAVRPLPEFREGVVMLDLVAHEHRPDADGVFPSGEAVVIERGVRFVWQRGEVYNELPFVVPFAPGQHLLPFISARLPEGTIVAVGGVRPAPGSYSDRIVQVAAAAIVLITERSH